MNILVIGASRGIGLEFVRQYRVAGDRVVATARDDAGLQRLAALGAKPLRLDVADAASASGLAWPIDGERFDVVVVNAGVYGPETRGLDTPTQLDFDHVMHTNVLGPMRVLPQVVDALAPGARVAVLSSQMGSIGLRAGTSGWLYRASKAAVNSVMKDVSLTLAGRAVVASLHPGWVRTEMGGGGADIDAETSVAGMRGVIAGLAPADNGGYFNYDGRQLPW
ncbi:SDR family oxidoreductase [Pelomonas cellulosilytica]|uniref:SDR family oxidoreductase n=1 Tax=Pelomonas cellulosilytica TaxID=2906762 RepID=A0ABS8Y2I5_9BURK|nr:SDR family oxidoreductase [Pelomonas sp. P8]MCE4557233.1 SDR family oxidoreductase [Pelomonas sp. P8]